jgi:hypothetical protein
MEPCSLVADEVGLTVPERQRRSDPTSRPNVAGAPERLHCREDRAAAGRNLQLSFKITI